MVKIQIYDDALNGSKQDKYKIMFGWIKFVCVKRFGELQFGGYIGIERVDEDGNLIPSNGPINENLATFKHDLFEGDVNEKDLVMLDLMAPDGNGNETATVDARGIETILDGRPNRYIMLYTSYGIQELKTIYDGIDEKYKKRCFIKLIKVEDRKNVEFAMTQFVKFVQEAKHGV